MEWTSVKDELPKEYKDMLVCGDIHKNPENGKWQRVLAYHPEAKHWCTNGEEIIKWEGYPVTHWMPLPEPPKV